MEDNNCGDSLLKVKCLGYGTGHHLHLHGLKQIIGWTQMAALITNNLILKHVEHCRKKESSYNTVI